MDDIKHQQCGYIVNKFELAMNLESTISNDYINRRKQEILNKFNAAFQTAKMESSQLQSLHSEMGKRQNELLKLTSATQREISKYFLTFQPLSCNPATFADLRLYGGPRIALNNGKLYIGTIVDGKRHGKGVIISQRGKIYEGELLLNQRNGVGVEIYENGNFYIGGFSASKRDGEGRMVWANRNAEKITFQYYSGAWKDGEPHGFGVHSTETWNFVGNFKQGIRNGKGTELKGDSLFDGSYSNNLRQGKGLCIEEGVEFYEGQFKSGRKHGYGKWKCFGSGQEYEGFFQDNKKEGIGVSVKDGLIYRGLFTEDRPNGTGQFISSKKNSPLAREKDARTMTEQNAKRTTNPKPRGELQSAQFVRSNPIPSLQPQLSVRSIQKISRPPKIGKLNTSKDKGSKQKDKNTESEKKSKGLGRDRLASAKVIRVVNENPEKHACNYRHCSCHKWQQNEADKLKIDQHRILRLFSARKALLKSIV